MTHPTAATPSRTRALPTGARPPGAPSHRVLPTGARSDRVLPTGARSHRALLVGALLTGALVMTGCGSDAPVPAASDTSPADTSAGPAAGHNDADIAFATGMRPHHQGAIEMAHLAEERASDPRVVDLARRIEAAQGPEIDSLTTWLSDWGAGVDGNDADRGDMDHGDMDHGDMDDGGMDDGGMDGMTEGDMRMLATAQGPEFDRLFLTQMIAHHRGAIEMATRQAAEGQDAEAIALAESIRDSQVAEIAEMEALLTDLGG